MPCEKWRIPWEVDRFQCKFFSHLFVCILLNSSYCRSDVFRKYEADVPILSAVKFKAARLLAARKAYCTASYGKIRVSGRSPVVRMCSLELALVTKIGGGRSKRREHRDPKGF